MTSHWCIVDWPVFAKNNCILLLACNSQSYWPETHQNLCCVHMKYKYRNKTGPFKALNWVRGLRHINQGGDYMGSGYVGYVPVNQADIPAGTTLRLFLYLLEISCYDWSSVPFFLSTCLIRLSWFDLISDKCSRQRYQVACLIFKISDL